MIPRLNNATKKTPFLAVQTSRAVACLAVIALAAGVFASCSSTGAASDSTQVQPQNTGPTVEQLAAAACLTIYSEHTELDAGSPDRWDLHAEDIGRASASLTKVVQSDPKYAALNGAFVRYAAYWKQHAYNYRNDPAALAQEVFTQSQPVLQAVLGACRAMNLPVR